MDFLSSGVKGLTKQQAREGIRVKNTLQLRTPATLLFRNWCLFVRSYTRESDRPNISAPCADTRRGSSSLL